MISILVIIACIWLIISIPVALVFGKLFYNFNLSYEEEKTIYEEQNNTVNQPAKVDLK
ncbi:hypothetical protein [Nostoc sp. 106C]|jgi:uncharacterized membrane protein|uniref:hypothetical protein n=1 Tax=Nostoc sp. 106C TaxID=1932667 RepID=UPI0014125D26|nr:hypothetical protein [Nostoc sp. 106C]